MYWTLLGVDAAHGCSGLAGFLYRCVPRLCTLLYNLDGAGTVEVDSGNPGSCIVGSRSLQVADTVAEAACIVVAGVVRRTADTSVYMLRQLDE